MKYGLALKDLLQRPSRKQPRMSGPELPPELVTVASNVRLPPELWAALDDVARFHTEVFGVMKSKRKVSRNDMIMTFLGWAVDAYWDDKGGKPGSLKEREAKVRAHAEKLARDRRK